MAWLAKPKPATEPAKPPLASHDEIAPDNAATPPEEQPAQVPQKSLEVTQTKRAPSVASPGLRPLPSNVELRACTQADLPALKRLLSLLLPIPYPAHFFREILEDPVTADLTLLAFWHDERGDAAAEPKATLIGAIRCRLLTRMPGGADESTARASSTTTTNTTPVAGDAPLLYLSTVALLSPYRSHGIATHLLDALVRRAAEKHGATRVGAHVWEANADGLAWYARRGFREVAREPGYYRRLSPSGAVVVEKGVD